MQCASLDLRHRHIHSTVCNIPVYSAVPALLCVCQPAQPRVDYLPFVMQTQPCLCDQSKSFLPRPHALCPISRLHWHRPAKQRKTRLSSRDRSYTGARCTSAQPGVGAGTSSSGPQQEVTRRGPIASDGRDVYWPQSFKEITEDAVKAVLAAVEKGHNRIEVEFPPLPTSDSKFL